MDNLQFDHLTRYAAVASRRNVVAAVVTAALAAFLGGDAAHEALGKRTQLGNLVHSTSHVEKNGSPEIDAPFVIPSEGR